MSRDPRVDAYIAKSAEFAKPILTYLRNTVHEAVPEVEEGVKWSHPAFDYKGVFCGMAAFKEHCTFGFWKHSLVFNEPVGTEREAMGSMGRITSVKDLPPRKEFIALLKRAAKLNDDGVKVEREAKPKKPEAKVPDYLASALKKNKAARVTFEGFSPSNRREYIEWLTDAKSDETREKRLAQAIEWMSEGKVRNWKYVR